MKARRPAKARPKTGRRPRLILVVGVLLAVAVFAGLFAGYARHRKATGEGPGFNVVLISMDTTRADHLGCYGRRPDPTPNIDDLARQGTLFRQCEASAPITLPSHASLFTGTDPFVHGARNNGTYYLRDENVTLPEILSKAGYATAGVVGCFVLNRESGLGQGCSLYDDLYSSPASWRKDTSADRAQLFERKADEVCDHALAWLRSHVSEKFFLFVHFYDPHFPYEPPPRFRESGLDPYDGEIAFVDEQIGRLRDAIRTAGVESRTLIVLTADHGESLGQHNEETHSYTVYDSALHVPLIFHAPGAIPEGREVDATVGSIDVVPTLLDFLDLPRKTDAQGMSLIPLAMGQPSPIDHPAYASTIAPFEEFGFSMVRCLVRDQWKYIHAPRPELYNLAEDPNELSNVADQKPERVRELREELRARIVAAPRPVWSGASSMPVEEGAAQALSALGYLAGTGVRSQSAPQPSEELDYFEPRGADPKDHMADVRALQTALRAIDLGRFEEAEAAIRRILQDHPDHQANFSICHERLAFLLAVQKRYEEAIEHYRLALAASPQSAHVHVDMGSALSNLGRSAEGMEHYRAALELSPENATAHANLARELVRAGNVNDAIEHLREAIRIRPTYFDLYPLLAAALRKQGKIAEAATVIEESARLTPGDAAAQHGAAVMLVDLAEYGRAIALLRPAVDRDPGNVALAIALARLLATAPRADQRSGAEAVRLAERAASATGDSDPMVLDTLAAAYAEAGRFVDAIRVGRRAADILTARRDESLAGQVRGRLNLYSNGQAFHESK